MRRAALEAVLPTLRRVVRLRFALYSSASSNRFGKIRIISDRSYAWERNQAAQGNLHPCSAHEMIVPLGAARLEYMPDQIRRADLSFIRGVTDGECASRSIK
jgi:hypothetical protein